MIVPMKKYAFMVYHQEYTQFLQGLQEVGVVHVIERESGEIESQQLHDAYQNITALNNAIKVLQKRNIEPAIAAEANDGLKVLGEIQSLENDIEQYEQKKQALKKELQLMAPWGEFSWELIDKLTEQNIHLKFYTCQQRQFDEEWLNQYDLEVIDDNGSSICFIVIGKSESKVDIDAEEVRLPKVSISKLNAELADIDEVLAKTKEVLDSFAAKYIPLLERTKNEISKEIAFEKVLLNTAKKAEDKVMLLEGWVPIDKEESIEAFLQQSGAYYEAQMPEKDEQVPIKLKNSKFARLFESIGELYTFPDYKELDLTPFFAPFYMLFFGFCLGDTGYGLLITIGTLIGLYKVPVKFKPLMKLGMFLGIATTIMGIIGGTFFGIMLHPDDFGHAEASWLHSYQQYILSSDNLMVLSLGLGYIQVLFGMFLNAANKARMYGFKYAISQLGWNVIVLVTLPAFALGKFEAIDQSLGYNIAMVSGIIGGIPAFFYNTPGKNPLLNLGVGLWESYQVASGLLGDILSYIRLFALGLSSAILGNVFNQLAMQASGFGPEGGIGGVIGVLILIIILAFGHGLNFFMAALGSFVHPLRLTFVEFYKNAGFAGGGRKYSPFEN